MPASRKRADRQVSRAVAPDTPLIAAVPEGQRHSLKQRIDWATKNGWTGLRLTKPDELYLVGVSPGGTAEWYVPMYIPEIKPPPDLAVEPLRSEYLYSCREPGCGYPARFSIFVFGVFKGHTCHRHKTSFH